MIKIEEKTSQESTKNVRDLPVVEEEKVASILSAVIGIAGVFSSWYSDSIGILERFQAIG